MKIKCNIGTKINGKFGVQVLDSEGNPVAGKQRPLNGNAVSYDGAAKIFTAVDPGLDIGDFYYAKVGTGSVERTRSDTGLAVAKAAVTSTERPSRNSWVEVDNLDGTATYTITFTLPFSLGAVTGTISEVALYRDVSDTYLAGQLIKDELGDPTTVTILADEQLIVTYSMEFTGPLEGTLIGSGTVDADGVSTNYEIYAQPLLKWYNIHQNTDTTIRYSSGVIGDAHVYASNGTTKLASTTIGSSVVSHDGIGTVSWNNSAASFAPSSFSSTDVRYLLFSSTSSSGSIDTATNTEASGDLGLVLCKFTPAINKGATKSLSVEVDFSVSV